MKTFTTTTFLLLVLLTLSTALSAQAPFRMNVGDGGPFTYGSVTFLTETGFDAQSIKGSTSDDITNTSNDGIYQSQRFVNGWGGHSESNWQQCGFTPGEAYTIHLHFAEIYNNTAGSRIFDISIEGALVVDDLDVYAAVGHDNYTVASANVIVSGDGCLDITMINGAADFAILSAIEVVSVGTPDFNQIAFPVELVSFEAQAMDGKVALNWATASEQNSDAFEVERSLDGTFFTAIDRVAAQGNSSVFVSYNSVDAAPVSGEQYYRLKQIDVDGATAYSATLEVTVEGGIDFSLFENPVTSGQVRFRVGNSTMDYLATIMDAQGRIIAEKTFSAHDGIGSLDLGDAASGVYYLTVGNLEFKRQAKVLKY